LRFCNFGFEFSHSFIFQFLSGSISLEFHAKLSENAWFVELRQGEWKRLASLMFRQKTLLVFGVLVAMVSAGTALIYRKAVHESPEVMVLLFLTTIMGTSIAMSGIFYRRLEESSESSRSSAKRLEDSESRFRHLFDISPFPAAVTSLTSNQVLAVNERAAERFGIPPAEAIGLHARDFYVDPAHRAMMVEQLQQKGQAYGLLIQLRTPLGEQFWAEVYARVVTFDGEPAALSVFHDVTERVNAEQALRASEQRLTTENKALTELTARQLGGSTVFEDRLSDILEVAANTVGVGRASMWRFESSNSVIRCLDLFEHASNRHSSGLLLQRSEFPVYFQALETERLIPAADAHHDRRTSQFSESYLKPLGIGAMLDVPLRQGDSTIGVLCLEHIGDERAWTPDEQNFALSLANLIVVALSDADRRVAVERLAQSEARSSLIVDTAHDAFVGMNSDGKIVMWNAQAAVIFGWSAAEAIGESLANLIIPSAFREAHRSGLKKFLSSGEAPVLNQRLELSALHRKGHEFPIEITITDPISSGEGHFFGAFLRDISERRAHEAELRRAKESAEAATRAKSEFLANMSHELRTPLNGVLGYTQLLQRSHSLTSDQRESLDAIANCGSHLLDLINDVLDLSKIEAGRFELEPRPTDLRQLTVDLRHVIAEPVRRKGLLFSVEVDPDVPTHIVIDGRHLRQVLLNLLGNAVKFTPEGEVTLILGRAEGDRLYCEVRDTGIGIEEENLQAIFQAFRQTRAGSSAGGTGLGLSISRRLVNFMGGELSVRSKLGRGSSFYFTLPLIAVEGALPDGESKEDEPLLDARLAPGEELTALVADDSSVNRRILASLLESAGVRVISAGGGIEAVSLATEHKPDVVLMDLRMHDIDGLQVTRQILSDPATASTPIIMVTASAFGDSRQAAFDAGCVDFIAKPIRAEQLFQKLQRHTKRHFVTTIEESDEDAETFIPDDGSLSEIGKRLEEAAAIGSIADLDAIAVELGKGSATDAKIGSRIARLRAKFDFVAVAQLAESLQTKPKGHRAE
jgi:PAS domain S-box-containing protein